MSTYVRNGIMLFALVVSAASFSRTAAETETQRPFFLRMFGDWHSVAVRSEPESYLSQHPDLAAAYIITGTRAARGIGIEFTVSRPDLADQAGSWLAYYYDPASHRSHGLIIGADGTLMRGEIMHEDQSDLLRIYDAANKLVWEERNHWPSADEFHSEARIVGGGEDVRIWYVTRRIEPERNSNHE